MSVYIGAMKRFGQTFEHPLDVLCQLKDWQASHDVALVVIQETVGGAVRAVGALLAVRADGKFAGYVSGGCIDADVVLQAQRAIQSGKAKTMRYGAGSPFVDLPLPCGGAIEVMILPSPSAESVGDIVQRLENRQRVNVSYSEAGIQLGYADEALNLNVVYEPKIRLRIAGRGADCLALTRIAEAAGFEVFLQVTDEDDLRAARAIGLDAERLSHPHDLPPLRDDAWTTFVLMFHDGDWEGPLLKQALEGPAFYIGAVGSKRTHQKRLEMLRALGETEQNLARMHGPIGLVSSLRDASLLAVSVLAEIVEHFKTRELRAAKRTALLLLAAGSASRFEAGDKLQADLNGQPVLAHSSRLIGAVTFGACVAVIAPEQSEREDILTADGWRIVKNADAKSGQASSLRKAIEAIEDNPEIDQILIVLGDMPAIPQHHLKEMLASAAPNINAMMSKDDEIILPPALFKRAEFSTLKAIAGDKGARAIFSSLSHTKTLKLSQKAAMDIDTRADLQRVKELIHG